jgi:hypothetical protein
MAFGLAEIVSLAPALFSCTFFIDAASNYTEYTINDYSVYKKFEEEKEHEKGSGGHRRLGWDRRGNGKQTH